MNCKHYNKDKEEKEKNMTNFVKGVEGKVLGTGGSIMDIIDGLHLYSQIQTLSAKDYGRLMGTLADPYVKEHIESNSDVKFLDENEIGRDKNASGYDLLTVGSDKRVQVKFRQYSGKTPYSRGTYLTTTRRHSEKNVGFASISGQVAYGVKEFDFLFLILAPSNAAFRTRDLWSCCCIPISKLRDPINPFYVTSCVSSDILKMGMGGVKVLEMACA